MCMRMHNIHMRNTYGGLQAQREASECGDATTHACILTGTGVTGAIRGCGLVSSGVVLPLRTP